MTRQTRTWKHYALWVKTSSYPSREWRFYRQRNAVEAEAAADRKADCDKVLRVVEITAEQFANGMANTQQRHRQASGAVRVAGNQFTKLRS